MNGPGGFIPRPATHDLLAVPAGAGQCRSEDRAESGLSTAGARRPA